MFAIICTTGYLDWYYTDATIESVAGSTVIRKEYGVLHPTNLIYVLPGLIADGSGFEYFTLTARWLTELKRQTSPQSR